MDKPRQWTKAESAAGQKLCKATAAFFPEAGIERAEEITETARIGEAQDKHLSELLALDNVVGVATSLKMKESKLTKQWALTVLVEEKLPKAKVSKESQVPAKVDSIPTDVLEVGKLEPQVFDFKVRPVPPGFSIGHHNITAGTFGCLVRDIRRCCCNLEKDCCCSASRQDCPGDYLVLSNNHVLADSNEGNQGDLIIQPGSFDGGIFPSDGCARLERFEPITFGVARQFPGRYNLVDAAVARPLNSRDMVASIIGQVMPRGIDQAFFGSPVIKAGRTTQVTQGFVIAVNATVVVGPYDTDGTKFGEFRHQILIVGDGGPFSAPGDSGSLVMDSNLNAVGLLFGGSPFITIANHISDVETALGVRPVTAPRTG